LPLPPPGTNLLEYFSQPFLPADAGQIPLEAQAVVASPSPSPEPAQVAARVSKAPRTSGAWKNGALEYERRDRQNRLRREGAAALLLQPKLLAEIRELEARNKESALN
jgi:hypothetical protein